jgi:hypothetical protein
MIKNILYQQQEERDGLLKHAYIERIDVLTKAEYLITGLVKLITGPRRAENRFCMQKRSSCGTVDPGML